MLQRVYKSGAGLSAHAGARAFPACRGGCGSAKKLLVPVIRHGLSAWSARERAVINCDKDVWTSLERRAKLLEISSHWIMSCHLRLLRNLILYS